VQNAVALLCTNQKRAQSYEKKSIFANILALFSLKNAEFLFLSSVNFTFSFAEGLFWAVCRAFAGCWGGK